MSGRVKRIGILGGTFDPVHLGHLRMGEIAKRELKLDELWFMPSGTPAYKLESHGVSSGEHRLNMLRLALAGLPDFTISEIELGRKGNTYTSDTLTELSRSCPGAHFYFILGGDSLDYLDRWHDAVTIFRLATVAAFPRADFSKDRLKEKAASLRKLGARIRLLDMEPFDFSSTEIRRRAEKGEGLSDLVPEPVARYILSNDLYRGDENDDK